MRYLTIKLVGESVYFFKDGFFDGNGAAEEVVVRQVVAKVFEMRRQVKRPGATKAAIEVASVQRNLMSTL